MIDKTGLIAASPNPMPRNNYIFIDRENVPESELLRIKEKPVKIFYVIGAQQKSLPIELVQQIASLPGQVEIVRTPIPGRNALDMVIAYEIGRLSGSDPVGYFHIISKDGDYDVLIKHLKALKIHAGRRESLAEVPLLMNAKERRVHIVSHFKANPENRPKTRKGLDKTINAIFAKSLSDQDVDGLVNHLVNNKVIEFDGDNGVIFCEL